MFEDKTITSQIEKESFSFTERADGSFELFHRDSITGQLTSCGLSISPIPQNARNYIRDNSYKLYCHNFDLLQNGCLDQKVVKFMISSIFAGAQNWTAWKVIGVSHAVDLFYKGHQTAYKSKEGKPQSIQRAHIFNYDKFLDLFFIGRQKPLCDDDFVKLCWVLDCTVLCLREENPKCEIHSFNNLSFVQHNVGSLPNDFTSQKTPFFKNTGRGFSAASGKKYVMKN